MQCPHVEGECNGCVPTKNSKIHYIVTIRLVLQTCRLTVTTRQHATTVEKNSTSPISKPSGVVALWNTP